MRIFLLGGHYHKEPHNTIFKFKEVFIYDQRCSLFVFISIWFCVKCETRKQKIKKKNAKLHLIL